MENISSVVLLECTKFVSCAAWKVPLNPHESPKNPDGENYLAPKFLQWLFDQRKISHVLYQKILIGIV